MSNAALQKFKKKRVDCSPISGVADMSELIYGGHCDDVQDGRIVAALTEALMLPPKELIKVNVNQAQATGAKGVGRHRQVGAMPPPLARKFFHFDH